jgi:hypothetical protein
MQAGDIIFVRGGNSPISSLIRLLDGEFSHCCIAVSPTQILEAQRFIKSRITDLYFKEGNYVVVDLGLSQEQREIVKQIAPSLTGYDYDYVQVIGFFFEKLLNINIDQYFDSDDKFVCSELVDIILYYIGFIDEEEYVGDHTPNELYRFLKRFTVIDK